MMDFINNNYVWVLTFIGVEIGFFMINFIWMKVKKPESNSIVSLINSIESTILIGAIAYVGAPMWFTIGLAVLCVVSLASPLLLKLKYSL